MAGSRLHSGDLAEVPSLSGRLRRDRNWSRTVDNGRDIPVDSACGPVCDVARLSCSQAGAALDPQITWIICLSDIERESDYGSIKRCKRERFYKCNTVARAILQKMSRSL